ncbi:hypothetical protein [Bacillus suaedae]|uniref:Uncharacterized protein n=1 Tax=Halalkalibacter suaedae TaxID=2822140 RepID=A0A940WWS7_9BACI|nr:hypothetical protein [Bacillus suaedae]MBP3951828.1 hypothetical protein [Bacillus suaedae]
MTNYYYLASDKKMGSGIGSVDFTKTEPHLIPGFDYPIQIEIFNGIEKDWQLQELLHYIRNHTAPYEVCTVQIANVINSNRTELEIQKKHKVLLNEIVDPKQLLLQEGHLLTVKKVPI